MIGIFLLGNTTCLYIYYIWKKIGGWWRSTLLQYLGWKETTISVKIKNNGFVNFIWIMKLPTYNLSYNTRDLIIWQMCFQVVISGINFVASGIGTRMSPPIRVNCLEDLYFFVVISLPFCREPSRSLSITFGVDDFLEVHLPEFIFESVDVTMCPTFL